MKQLVLLSILVSCSYVLCFSQSKPITYYLPDITYNPDIPTPESVLGYQIGDWHLTHDQLVMYMRILAEASPRITLTDYARSYEHRPLIYLTITSETNHARLSDIKAQHQQLSQPGAYSSADVADMPVVVYQGFSIHGNEPSGSNAAPLVAYYLAAAQTEDVNQMLDQMVVLLDPSFNPDGMTRFATWANMHKNKHLTSDPQDREYSEVWPRGRTNHYWFDLNRDWLLVQHPESQGRIRTFHEWKPNVLTDHHEMGSNSTFFFMPGEPTRTNPITPPLNQELTAKIGTFHAKALDQIGSLYYSGEGYDDFYYGKGSTYPDANGAIGILFEQASSRGHLQETDNGLLSFPFTIRNQVTTALSTQQAAQELREELLRYQQNFYAEALEDAAKDTRKAFVFGEPGDRSRTQALIDILLQHHIQVYPLKDELKVNEQTFPADVSYVVPTDQPQYRLIRGIFDTQTSFQDSLFYDVSSWTLPLAFNLPMESIGARVFSEELLGEPVADTQRSEAPLVSKSAYAYIVDWEDYQAPQLAYHLLQNGLRMKVSHTTFTVDGQAYPRGTLLLPVQNQSVDADEVHRIVQEGVTQTGLPVVGVTSGKASLGSDLGSRYFSTLETPKILLLVGNGVSSYDAGEVWHLFDQRYDIPIAMAEADRLSGMDLDRYTTIIMVNGSYGSVSSTSVNKLRSWLTQGGTLVAMRGAANWARQQQLIDLQLKEEEENANEEEEPVERLPYKDLSRNAGGSVIGGAIFEVNADLSHPLFYGYRRDRLPVFRRGTQFFAPAKNPYATPAVYTEEPLLSGYVNAKNLRMLSGSAAAVVGNLGSGRVIALADNPNFRAFWYGTNKIFANAVFFGSTISRQATLNAPPKK